jgi:hypothetical protein
MLNQPFHIIIPGGDFPESPALEAAMIVRVDRDIAGTHSMGFRDSARAELTKSWL